VPQLRPMETSNRPSRSAIWPRPREQPTSRATFGRTNKLGTAAEMMRSLKDNSISKSAFDRLNDNERAANTKIVRGVLHTKNRPEYTKVYGTLVDGIQEETSQRRNYGGN
jgi:hypothetical protein